MIIIFCEQINSAGTNLKKKLWTKNTVKAPFANLLIIVLLKLISLNNIKMYIAKNITNGLQ